MTLGVFRPAPCLQGREGARDRSPSLIPSEGRWQPLLAGPLLVEIEKCSVPDERMRLSPSAAPSGFLFPACVSPPSPAGPAPPSIGEMPWLMQPHPRQGTQRGGGMSHRVGTHAAPLLCGLTTFWPPGLPPSLCRCWVSKQVCSPWASETRAPGYLHTSHVLPR